MARKDEKISLLKEVPLFWGCSEKELKHIAKVAEQVDLPAGAVLMREGEPGREMYIIADGNAKVTVSGRKRATVGKGEVVGELALLDHGLRTATVTAEAPMSAFIVDARGFATVLNDAPSVAVKVARGLATRLRSAEKSPTH